ncbi:3'(2'),5'-bisphosphate nucleotidase CysQ [Tropicimonas sp. IMCC34043]|uniref:inositol monophosphatase family protein n=1 Tax=Tropicimonas sp. IMCC34043 TaxID=2248760 RepID=UPI000E27ABF0|nr:3'(2'),5'-bisphosphate nucleotidase CysQ [Tropicimonas sp. IMCC34043]
MPENDLALLIDAAMAAGEIAQRHFRTDHMVWQKDDGQGPVTEADLEVDRMLRETLTAARPGYGWMSEETPDDAARLGKSRLFVVDPIDGTRAFTEGQSAWAHSLAVVEDGAVTDAVVFLPMLERMFTARRGAGARLNGAPMAASRRERIAGATMLAARGTLDPRHWPDVPPPVERHFRSSLAYRLSLVGAGRFDCMLTLRQSWEWDIAAGALIATEAGATVSDRMGRPLRFNTPGRQTDGVAAAAPGIHKEILPRDRAWVPDGVKRPGP